MSSNEQQPPTTFEDALAELEALTRKLEDPATGLDEAIELYEQGTHLARACMERLEKAELKVEQLRARMEGRDGPSDDDSEQPGTLFADAP